LRVRGAGVARATFILEEEEEEWKTRRRRRIFLISSRSQRTELLTTRCKLSQYVEYFREHGM
jgi:hypothetical protein